MPSKAPAAQKRHKNLFVLVVIILLVAIAAVLIATFVPRVSNAAGVQNAGKKAVSSLSGAFGCTVDMTVNGTEYEVKLQKPANGDSTMTFVKPAILSPMSFEKTDDGIKVKFGTLEAAVDASSIPQSSLFNAVVDTFETCAKSGIKAKFLGDDLNLTGTSPAGPFTLTLDSSMKPKTLSIPSLNLNATFKDFKYS